MLMRDIVLPFVSVHVSVTLWYCV